MVVWKRLWWIMNAVNRKYNIIEFSRKKLEVVYSFGITYLEQI